jgi:hypothetical protein
MGVSAFAQFEPPDQIGPPVGLMFVESATWGKSFASARSIPVWNLFARSFCAMVAKMRSHESKVSPSNGDELDCSLNLPEKNVFGTKTQSHFD